MRGVTSYILNHPNPVVGLGVYDVCANVLHTVMVYTVSEYCVMVNLIKELSMFIVFEGHDGVGKSTQVTKLREYFESLGRNVVQVRTPGTTPIAEELRLLANRPYGADLATPDVRNLLMSAARIQTWQTVIKPALAKGSVVIADRWLWSGYLYQIVGEGLDYNEWKIINRVLLTKDASPDLTIVMTLDESERRRRKRILNASQESIGVDAMELQGEEFDNKIAKAIHACKELAILSSRICVIQPHSDSDIDTVFKLVVGHVDYVEKHP